MWSTKGAKTILRRISYVGVAVIEGRAESGEDQERMKVSLKKNVDVYPLSDIATVSHVAWRGIKNIRRLAESALYTEPGVEVRHVVDSRRRCSDLLLEIVRPEVAWLVKKL